MTAHDDLAEMDASERHARHRVAQAGLIFLTLCSVLAVGVIVSIAVTLVATGHGGQLFALALAVLGILGGFVCLFGEPDGGDR